MVKRLTITYRPQQIPLEGFDKEIELDFTQGIDAEKLILSLQSSKEVTVLLLRYIGYDYKEITRIMNLKSQGEYYMHWGKLRKQVERIRETLYN